jgi:hypothetical protein
MGNYYHGELQINIDPKTLKFSDCFDLIKEFAHLGFENKSDLFIEITDENGVTFDCFSCFEDDNIIDKSAQDVQKLIYQTLLARCNKSFADDYEYANLIYDSEDVEFFKRVENNEIN